jgi:hypothetical protein
MIKLYRLALLLLFIPVLFTLYGCAKHVGEDNVPEVAESLNFVGELLAEEGLVYLHGKDPQLAQDVIVELGLIIAQARLYEDNEATASDFLNTTTTVLERINIHVDVLDPEVADKITRNIDRASRLIEKHIKPVDLPTETGIYIKSLTSGIEQGIELFLESLPGQSSDQGEVI